MKKIIHKNGTLIKRIKTDFLSVFIHVICVLFCGLLNVCIVRAQAPEQDCFNALYVCSNHYSQSNSYMGYGSIQELPAGSACIPAETNSVWYLFHVISGGTLTFEINPVNPADDYDYVMYNLSANTCADIVSGVALPVRCNFSSTPGSTGLANGFAGASEPSNGPNQCAPLNVNSGETYVLLVNNFTSTTTGYSLDFAGSASIVNNVPPVIDSISFATCNPKSITVWLNEPVKCSSIDADGSDFTVTGPSAVVVTSASGTGCGASGFTNNIVLTFNNRISATGTYNVTAQIGTDLNGVLDICGNAIAIGSQFNFTVQHIGPNVSISGVTNATCGNADGTASAQVTLGTSPYTYSWNSTPPQGSPNAIGLAPGTYEVIITDGNGCTAITTVTIVNLNAPTVSAPTVTGISCNGLNDGTASVTVSGGVPPYTYSWSTIPVQTNAMATGLASGNYSVTIEDSHHCQIIRTCTITEPSNIHITSSVTTAACNVADGSATVTASGGTPPYTYIWSTVPVQISATANNLAAGVYNVTVTDAHNCTSTKQIFVGNNTAPDASVVSRSPSCGTPIGKATVTANGGNPPYTYQWNTVPPQNIATVTGLLPGIYYCIVKDASNCVQIIYVKIDSLPPPVATLSNTVNASCGVSNGSAAVAVSSGTLPYHYVWNTAPVQTTATATGLIAGNYQCIASDSVGCSDTVNATIVQLPGVSSFSNTSNCIGSPVQFTSVSSTHPTAWSWNFGDPASGLSNQSLLQNPVHTYTTAGTYTVKVNFMGGCLPDSASQNVVAHPLPVASFYPYPNLFIKKVLGRFVYNGSPVSTYNWDFGNGESSADPAPATSYPDTGIFTVRLTVIDQYGCIDSTSNPVEVLNEPTLYLPSAFSPNGDGKNDIYKIYGIGISEIEFIVYNRWGDAVYATTDLDQAFNIGWDGKFKGKLLPPTVFAYSIYVRYVTGVEYYAAGSLTLER